MSSAKDFFSPGDREAIRQAVLHAESDTSGEIRVHVENTCRGDVLDRTAFVFGQLKMHRTKHRNGVLIYLAVKDRKFAIIGDAGINRRVPENFWDDIRQKMEGKFRENRFSEGLAEGITEVGHHLKKFFPHMKDDVNELPDDISFGKE